MSRPLTRSREHRMIAGVCGGLANYLNMDPTLVRVLAVAATVATGGIVGLVAYLVGALVIPEESVAGDPPLHDPASLGGTGSQRPVFPPAPTQQTRPAQQYEAAPEDPVHRGDDLR